MIDSKFQRARLKRFRTWEWVRNRVRKRRVRAIWGLEWGYTGDLGLRIVLNMSREKDIRYGCLKTDPVGKAVNVVEGKKVRVLSGTHRVLRSPLHSLRWRSGGQGWTDLSGACGNLGVLFNSWWCGSWKKSSKTTIYSSSVCAYYKSRVLHLHRLYWDWPSWRSAMWVPWRNTLSTAPQTHHICKLSTLLRFVIIHLVTNPSQAGTISLFWPLKHGRRLE